MNVEAGLGFKAQIAEVNFYTDWFCRDTATDPQKLAVNNLNPVLDYVNYLRFLRGSPSEAQVLRYQDYLLFGQVQTGLRERNFAAQSSINYVYRDGQIYNDRFLSEPFEHVLNRGLEWSLSNNSPEIKRDQADVQGWKNAVLSLTDAPLGSKRIQITGKGIVEGTHHGDNFVDIYEKRIDRKSGDWFIRMTRNSSDLDYSSYRQIAEQKEPDYFVGFSGPIDAWFAQHILKIDPSLDQRSVNQIFAQDFGLRQGAMEEDVFQKIFTASLPVARNYLRVLCSQEFNPLEIAKAFQALIVKNDLEVEREKPALSPIVFDRSTRFGSSGMFDLNMPVVFKSLGEEVAWLSRQQVLARNVGCGLSVGFNLFGTVEHSGLTRSFPSNFIDYLGLSNSVGKFGVPGLIGKLESTGFVCPDKECGYRAKGPVGNQCPGCGLTKEEFRARGGVVCQ